PNARFFPLSGVEAMLAEGVASFERERAHLGLAADAPMPPAHFLAVSGGGDDGAFGAGLLVGWGESGTRPEFRLVTGVSTGALIAPFAYLGKPYDEKLSQVYTTINADNIFVQRSLLGAIFEDAMADTTPLFEMISLYVDEQMMADIAAEYEKGRLLLIGSTQLDAQVPVIWNIGAIAASGKPGSLDLIRKILRASSAVPGAFQPVLIDVELDGQKYQELHVDGGAIAQMFVYPPGIHLRDARPRERHAWLIRNARQDLAWAETEPRTLSIAGRAISTMIHSSGTNDILRIYFITQRDGVDYNLAVIGPDFDTPHIADFDPTYMKALYHYGYELGRKGYPWMKMPPGLGQAAVTN
ncbi:MAG TPA: patatin-like phospholipase family protein, partial [Kiloniellales bacterium]|nr:patatin-like phospholipase family protein [Kiloniellales bacterium]